MYPVEYPTKSLFSMVHQFADLPTWPCGNPCLGTGIWRLCMENPWNSSNGGSSSLDPAVDRKISRWNWTSDHHGSSTDDSRYEKKSSSLPRYALRLPLVMEGIMDASATRRFSTPVRGSSDLKPLKKEKLRLQWKILVLMVVEWEIHGIWPIIRGLQGMSKVNMAPITWIYGRYVYGLLEFLWL